MEFNKAFLSWKKRLRAVCITVIVLKSITLSAKHFIKATFGTAFSFFATNTKSDSGGEWQNFYIISPRNVCGYKLQRMIWFYDLENLEIQNAIIFFAQP